MGGSVIGLAVRPKRNVPGRHDVTGAFAPAALKFAKLPCFDACPIIVFDEQLPPVRRRREVRAELARHERADVLAFFCHGGARSLQAGWDISSVDDLAREVARLGARHVLLMACLTGADRRKDTTDREPGPGGDGGFADALRDRLVGDHGWTGSIFAHGTKGHSTDNPYLRRFDAISGAGGQWLVEPGSELWPAWRRALRETDLEHRVWAMTPDELDAELRV